MAADVEGGLPSGENREGDVPEMAMRTDEPVRDVTLLADDFDGTVLGEREPTLREFPFGEFDERMIAESLGPVVVVRQVEEEAEE